MTSQTAAARDLLAGPAHRVAPHLLGAILTSLRPEGTVRVRLTEVEAYRGDGSDPAAHTHRGRTARNATMYGRPGTLYVYFSYGMHWCANVVCGSVGTGDAVLLRAGEVVEGLELASQRRPAARGDSELARGPARLTQAVGITGTDDGADLVGRPERFELALATGVPHRVRSGPRVGIGRAADLPWRFWLDAEPSVSAYRRSPRASTPDPAD